MYKLRKKLRDPIMFWAAALTIILSPSCVYSQDGSQSVPKQVDLIVEGNRIVASNIRFSRFDDHRLNAQERIIDSHIGQAVIVLVTNQRIIGYGVISGWRSVSRIPNERIERISAEDFGGLVVTSERMLNFNGESGVWGERDRRAGR